MKQGWEIKKLGEICNKITNIKWNEIDKTTSFPYIDLSAVDRENSSIHDYEYINISNAPSRAKQIVKVGDILFATTRPMLKRACIIPNEFNNAIASTGFCVLRPQGTVLSEWIYHNIKSNRFYKYIEPIQKGVSYPAVTDNEVKDFCIPVPPREEQERIVEELDCLSGVIERKREQLRELDALAQSIFYQMFGDPITNEKGWEVKKLKDIFSVKIGPFGSLLHNSDYISGGTPLVNPIHMHNEKICPDFDFTVSDDKLKELGNYILHIGDIVLARRGDIGRCAIVGMNEDGYLCGTGSLFIRPTTNINSIFTIKQIRCNSMIEHLTSLAKGATMLNINCKIVEELNVILPPLALQQEFADKIEAIEKQKELIKKSISETETLFNARMEYYFN